MKIGWATPRVARSAIGRESIAVTDLLAKAGHDVTLIATEWERPDGDQLHPSSARSVYWRDLAPEQMRSDFDMIVVNVGDNFLLHGGIFALLDAAPCVGVFHDFYLHNLFRGWFVLQELGVKVAEEALVRTYGEETRQDARLAISEALPLETLAKTFPMTEWVGRRCIAALAHSTFYVDRLLASCPGPVSVAALPVQPRGVEPLAHRERSKLVALTVGVMNPNKCLDRVIEALSLEALAGRVAYRLAGPIEDDQRARLEAVAETTGFKDLTILGPVTNDVLDQELAGADIICCLRSPVLEGASGSAIEGLLSGRPVVVADAGFYADLPDDLVCKVPADIPISTLAASLAKLADDEGLRRSLGERASRWATETFRSDLYVEKLIALLDAAQAARAALGVGGAVGAELRNLGVSQDDPSIARIGAILDGLFA